ncbi:MAG: pentapeptide repeat-containing protein [Oscillatoriales cyanobacterium RM1_1_9]|nr:pentapeptide repeat-containing protein [Oscillatoriales cyanobacterium RM1_1_9]
MIVNLSHANLNEALLIGTDLRRSDLQQAKSFESQSRKR